MQCIPILFHFPILKPFQNYWATVCSCQIFLMCVIKHKFSSPSLAVIHRLFWGRDAYICGNDKTNV